MFHFGVNFIFFSFECLIYIVLHCMIYAASVHVLNLLTALSSQYLVLNISETCGRHFLFCLWRVLSLGA